MISNAYIEIATEVLAACQSKALWFPNLGEAAVLGWAESFQDSRMSREELIAGVKRAYQDAPDDFRPLPSTIIRHARAAYFEALREIPDDRRESMTDAIHALQAMGFAPPVAHRVARQIALGRKCTPALTPQQAGELRELLALESAKRQQLARPAAVAELGGYIRRVSRAVPDA